MWIHTINISYQLKNNCVQMRLYKSIEFGTQFYVGLIYSTAFGTVACVCYLIHVDLKCLSRTVNHIQRYIMNVQFMKIVRIIQIIRCERMEHRK